MDTQEEIKKLKKRITELEVQVSKEKDRLHEGDEYWYIYDSGEVFSEVWEGYNAERDRIEIGNVFRTEKEAEFAVEKLKVEAELRKFSRPFEYGGNNYTFNYYHEKENIVKFLASKVYQDPGALYFESTDQVEEAVSIVGEERIKKYIFEVE